MLLLAFVRIPIALAMGIVGIVGYAYMRDWSWGAAFATVQTKIYETGRNYTLSVVPLFILMGNLVTRAGMSQELFRAAYAFIGHFRGGLAMATIVACGRLRRHLRLVHRHRGDLRQGRLPVDEEVRLLGRARGRRHRLRRHARHPDPALHHPGHLRHHDRHEHRQAVRRRHPAGRTRGCPAVPGRPLRHLAGSDRRPARRARQLEGAPRDPAGIRLVRPGRRRGDRLGEPRPAGVG